MKHNHTLTAAIVILLAISLAVLVADNTITSSISNREFYVGVEFAYGDSFSLLKSLVDQVKDYTNLIVLGSPALTFNRTALDQSVSYINQTGLRFIVLITDSNMYNQSNGYPPENTIFDWMGNATQKYSDKLLGIYRFDEPGGNQIDSGPFKLVKNATSYQQAANEYVGSLSIIINYYLAHGAPKTFTADYALYWFDYKSNYTTVLAEFVGNESRQRIVALDRGAAQSFGKDWGVIVNWKYDSAPYLESGDELYNDLSQAYSAGAKYAVVFSYPNITESSYGTLTQDHFDALKTFWFNLHHNVGSFPKTQATVAYVVPKDYGFGFRTARDNIWGIFPPDNLSTKIWNDTTDVLLPKYGYRLNIIYDEPNATATTTNNYEQIYYWNQTIP